MESIPLLTVEGILLRWRVAAAKNDIVQARQVLQQATVDFPEDLEVLNAWCEFAFNHETANDAEAALIVTAHWIAVLEPASGMKPPS